jgi:two-component system NarL family sensor kinase
MTPSFQADTEKLQRRTRELSILNAIAQALNREVNLDRALQSTLTEVLDLFELRTGWVWLLREPGGESYLAAQRNLPPVLADNPSSMTGWCYCLNTYLEGDMAGAANVNVVTCSRLEGLIDGTDGLRHHASIPLDAHGKKLGVMNVASTDWGGLSEDDLQLLTTVGDMLSIAIERTRLFEGSVRLGALEERNRLSREIHDTLAQGLTAISLQLETADAVLDSHDPEAAQSAVRQALNLTRASLEEARRSVLDLRAAPLEGRGLVEALSELAQGFQEQSGVEIDFEQIGGERPLPLRLESGLYRIAQEALNNVRRHAAATQVIIRLTVTPELVELLIDDNGQGFEASQIPAGRFGLLGLQERARLLGGTLRVRSTPGEGTQIRARFALDQGI